MRSINKTKQVSRCKMHVRLHLDKNIPGVKGVARGALGCPWAPLCKPFLSKQPIIFHGENAMTIMFDTVWPPPPPLETSWLRPCKYISLKPVIFFSKIKPPYLYENIGKSSVGYSHGNSCKGILFTIFNIPYSVNTSRLIANCIRLTLSVYTRSCKFSSKFTRNVW